MACGGGSRETEGQRPQELRDQIVCEARGSARGTFGASRLSQWAPRELFSPPLARAIITDLIKMKSETGHVGGARSASKWWTITEIVLAPILF